MPPIKSSRPYLDLGISAAEPPGSRGIAQSTHRYRVNERLRLTNGGNSVQRTGGSCKVLALLPYEGNGVVQYRVKSDSEAFERVVSEEDLGRHSG
jgi:hypothetical protein